MTTTTIDALTELGYAELTLQAKRQCEIAIKEESDEVAERHFNYAALLTSCAVRAEQFGYK